MLQLELFLASFLLCFLLFLLFFFMSKSPSLSHSKFPKSYPLIGSAFTVYANRSRRHQWMAEILCASTTGTCVLHRPLGQYQLFTANPENVRHILKTQFHLYPKGESSNTIFQDFLGSGIFNVDSDHWKFQRQISSYEFNTKSLRKFIHSVVETELSNSLLPILLRALNTSSVIDLQNLLERFTFDNVCKIAFNFDPEYLTASPLPSKFATSFEYSAMISALRFLCLFPITWKVKRAFDIGSEKLLKKTISDVRGFAESIVKKKKEELSEKSSLQADDLLSRILMSGHVNETLVTDMVISFILAGCDTTSAALTWFFWLVSCNPKVEEEIVKEIRAKSESPVYDEVKEMVYIHAALCESMRLYPPVPSDNKVAASDDVLPDGTVVKKGMRVTYHPYAMGRMEKLWGSDWPEFRPERWLEKDGVSGKWSFVGKDAYMYPVFQAGPRICLGKDMAFLQMKRIVSGVLGHYRVVSEKGSEPVYDSFLTAKMVGGFQVRIEERCS